jgi:hypothetical protein
MSDDDDNEANDGLIQGPIFYVSYAHSCSDPMPMSSAGYYLAQLKRGDQGADSWFAGNKEASEELLCALKRADLKSRQPA